MQKRKCPLPLDNVPTDEKLELGAVGNSKLGVKAADLGVFVGRPLIEGHAVLVAALDHEWARRHHVGHFTVVVRVAEVKRKDGIFFIKQESERDIVPADLPDPLIEIG